MKKKFGDRLRVVRGEKTLKEAAALLKTNFQNLQRWESGEREPPLEMIHRIGETFGVSLDWLFGLDSVQREAGSVAEHKLYDHAGSGEFSAMVDLIASQQRVIERMTVMLSGGTGRAAAPADGGGRGATKTA